MFIEYLNYENKRINREFVNIIFSSFINLAGLPLVSDSSTSGLLFALLPTHFLDCSTLRTESAPHDQSHTTL